MSNVISLDAFKRGQLVAPLIPVDYPRLVDKILTLPTGKPSNGARYLLLQIARLLRDGHNEISYTYIQNNFGITNKTVSAYIEELEDYALLRVRRSRIGKIAATNQFEIDFKGPLGGDMPTLKTPRKFNERSTGKIPVPRRGVQEKVKSNKDIVNTNNLITKVIRRTAPTFDTVDEAVAASTKRVVRRREEQVAKVLRPASQLTLAGVKAAWAKSMLKHYPSVPPVTITARDFAVFKARILPLLSSANITDVFDYFVESWATLRETKFNWLRAKGKDVALAPSIPELMRYWKIFAQAFADSRMVEANTAAKLTRSREDELQDALQEAGRSAAQTAAEMKAMRLRLERAERIAYASKAKPAEETRSLTDRRKALEESYNDDVELPDWKS